MSTQPEVKVDEAQVDRAMKGETVMVPIPGGGEIRLIMRRRMLYLQQLPEPGTIQDRLPTGEGGVSESPLSA